MPQSVCVVGAGPSGLAAAKTLLYSPGAPFTVTVFDAQDRIGGLWPSSSSDVAGQIHPLMVANQSKHCMHFSDLAWEPGSLQMPRAWMVGRYLQRYADRYLAGHPSFEMHLGTRIVSAKPKDGRSGWDVVVQSGDKTEARHFEHLVVASGFFGKPVVPPSMSISPSSEVPVVHSSQYRDLKTLFGDRQSCKGKILVVGGQMSGVEIAATIASHLSSAVNSPGSLPLPDIDGCGVHHVMRRPPWVLPSFTTPEPNAVAPPFLPIDIVSNNLNNRTQPLTNTQGHVSEEMAGTIHSRLQTALGTDQAVFSQLLRIDQEERTKPPHAAVSDWYGEFVRSGAISLSRGTLASLDGQTATLQDGTKIQDVAAVVLATGFDSSSSLDFLPSDVLEKLQFSPSSSCLPLALAFHGTHHPDVPRLGFVGFYRGPYFGVIEMQAKLVARLWTEDSAQTLQRKLKADHSIERTLALKDNPRCSQFPMGDYPFLMQEFAEALSLPRTQHNAMAGLPSDTKPMDMVTPSQYISVSGENEEAALSREETQKTLGDALSSPRFVPRAVFRSLLGTWRLERDLKSRLPTHPSGHFSGTAQFLLRKRTTDGIQCAASPSSTQDSVDLNLGMEYLYIEDGEFKTDQGFGFRATRRYIWRYDETTEKLSVWFAKPDESKRADYLFHEIEFEQPDSRTKGWPAKAGHLCIDDYYDVKYIFAFAAVNLKQWSIEYTVNGPKKDYTITGTYTR